MQKAPIHQSHIYRQIKILRTLFEEGHPRNIPVKLFQNLKSGFGEKSFLRIFSCPYSATRGPRWPWIAHLIFFRLLKLIFFFFCRFQRRIYKNFLMSVQCKKPPLTNTMFIDIKISGTILKRVTQGTFL